MQKNSYFCNVSQHVLSEVVGLHLLGFCFISWISMIHRETIYGFSKTNTWILRSFDFNSVLTRQTSEKVAFKSSFDNLLEYFLPRTFARIISVLPEKIQKFLWLGGLQPPSSPRLVRLCSRHSFREINVSRKFHVIRQFLIAWRCNPRRDVLLLSYWLN